MRRVLLATLLIASAGSPVAAQTGPQTGPFAILDAMAADSCVEATATPVSFEVAATVSSECVSVEGLMQWNAVFDGIEGYYRANMGRRSATPDRMGVYGLADGASPDRPRPARLTGRSGQCQDLYEPDVFMVLGYCHYVDGPYIALGEMDLLGPTPERLTGQAVRARLGLLVEPEPGWPQRAYVEARAQRWLSLARGDDPAAYAEATELSGDDLDLDDPDARLHVVFRAQDTVFAKLRAQPVPVMRVWILAPPLPEPDMMPNSDDVEALACFRLGDWQDDRWPVALADADNDESRPFACLKIVRTIWPDEVLEYYVVPTEGLGLKEPAAFRH